jgi:predicted glycoside hydrolase/deacetylase ChbG (UPF0249 family)
VNEGIGYAHQNGILTSTTVMMNKPYAYELPIYQKQFPKLGFGIHLVLTSGKPLGSGYQTLTNEEGFFKRSFITDDESYDVEEVYQEFKTQLNAYIRLNGLPTHFDSHHGVHRKEKLKSVIQRLQKEYNIPFRNTFMYPSPPVRTVSTCVTAFYNKTVKLETLQSIIENIQEGETVEMMSHPGFVDIETIQGSIYNFKRIEELQILCSLEAKEWVEKNNVTLISYKGL